MSQFFYFLAYLNRFKKFSQADVNEFFILHLDGAGFEYFRLEEFYSEELIEELESQGIKVNRKKLMAITRNYEEGTIIWLETGNPEGGFIHILTVRNGEHLRQFEYYFGISDYREIAELIIETITNNEIIDIFTGGTHIVYTYQVGRNYLRIVIDADGYIITAYPYGK